MNKLKRCIQ